MEVKDRLSLKGKVIIRSHEAGTLHLYQSLVEMGKLDLARDLLADGKIELVQDNLVVASLNYRLSSEAAFPAAIQDVKSSIRFLRAHATEYGIDPSRAIVWGGSAGGHLAALAATTRPSLTVAVNGRRLVCDP